MAAFPAAESFTLFGLPFTQYRFAKAGDEIPEHAHDFDHGMIVAAGAVLAFGARELELKAGDRVVFPAGRRHGIRALSDGATIYNVMPPASTTLAGGMVVE